MEHARILIVEDEALVSLDIEHSLRGYGYDVVATVPSGEEALELIRAIRPDIVLMDIMIQGTLDGIRTAEIIKAETNTPVIYLSAYVDEDTLARAKKTAPFGYIPKPFNEVILHSTIEMALYKSRLERVVAENQYLLSTTLESIRAAVITTDSDGCIQYINNSALDLIKKSKKNAVGKRLETCINVYDEKGASILPLHGTDDKAENIDALQIRGTLEIGSNTEKIPIEASINPLIGSYERGGGHVFVIEDISERLMAEKFRSRLVSIVESSEDAILSTDMDGIIQSWNRGAELIFGYTHDEIVGKDLTTLAPLYQPDSLPVLLDQLRTGKATGNHETARKTRDGRIVYIAFTLSPIKDKKDEITGASIIARDITRRKELEKEILDISERERKRIGQDLHDSLGQHLTGILFKTRVLKQKQKKSDSVERTLSPSDIEALEEIELLLQQAVSKSRGLAKGLVPITLQSEGLIGILQELVEHAETMYGIKTNFSYDDLDIRDMTTAMQLYRIAQEAVTNAYKHGNPSRIDIELRRDFTEVILRIINDGKPLIITEGRGLGLRIMEYRADLIGGHLAVYGVANGGTAVVCKVPFKEQWNENERE